MKKSRILSAILALAMIFTALVPVLATAAAPNSTEVVIHKIEMPTIDDTWPRGGGATGDAYDGSELPSITDYFGADAKELAGVYFTRYAVSKTEYDAMVANPGNFDTAEKVIAAYPGLTGVEVGPTTNTGLSVTLPDGYYWFVEDTSRPLPDGRTISDNAAVPFGLALPMYKSDGTTFTTGTNALHLYPKNTATKPEIDKNFAQTNGLLDSTDLTTIEGGADYANYQADKATATAHVGQEVPYEVKTRIPAGTNYQKLVWTDVMTNGLTYNKDLVITAGTLNLTAGTDYTLTQDDRGFTLMMTAAGLTKINAVTKPATGAGTDVEVTLTYTATVNENAIVDIPEKNNISLDYGNTPGQDIVEQPVTPVNNQLNVTKTWSTGTVPEGVNVVYTLSDGTNSYPVFLTNTTTGTIDLGNGVTFTVTGPFSGTFSGEALATGTWTISERISGYAPAYTGGTDGNVTINNVKDDDNPEPLNPTEPEVVNGGEKFLKVDGVTKSPLAGAEFVVKNNRVNDPDNGKFLALKDATTQADEVAAYQAAEAAYQAAVAAATTDAPDTENIAALKATRDATYEAMNMQWTWVAAEADGFKFISAQDGTFEVTGLAYGAYQLIETKPPTGYAENRTPRDFTVGLGTYADETVITIENNKVTIPQTGGIGTIIFVIAGLAIMGTAVIVMKKRQELDV